MNLEPQTVEEFEAHIRGEIQPRPKILIHPETREYYRLVPKDPRCTSYGSLDEGKSVRDAYYAPIHIAPINVDFYSIRKEAMAHAIDNGFTVPENCHIESYRLSEKHLREGEKLLSPTKLYALLQAIGVDSYWWPMEDPNYDFDHVYGDARINVLFRGSKPLGAILWDDGDIEKTKTATWIMVGVRPEERANKYGSFLIRWQMQELLKLGTEQLNFYTGDTDFIVTSEGRIPASAYYERLGAKKIGVAVWDHKAVDKDLPSLLKIDHSMLDIEPQYFQHPDTQEPLGRFSASELARRLDAAFGHTPATKK